MFFFFGKQTILTVKHFNGMYLNNEYINSGISYKKITALDGYNIFSWENIVDGSQLN